MTQPAEGVRPTRELVDATRDMIAWQQMEAAKKYTIAKALDQVYRGLSLYRGLVEELRDDICDKADSEGFKFWNEQIPVVEGYQKALMDAMEELRELHGFDFISLHAELLNEDAKRKAKRKDDNTVKEHGDSDHESPTTNITTETIKQPHSGQTKDATDSHFPE